MTQIPQRDILLNFTGLGKHPNKFLPHDEKIIQVCRKYGKRKEVTVRSEKGEPVPVIKIFEATALRIRWTIIFHIRYSYINRH